MFLYILSRSALKTLVVRPVVIRSSFRTFKKEMKKIGSRTKIFWQTPTHPKQNLNDETSQKCPSLLCELAAASQGLILSHPPQENILCPLCHRHHQHYYQHHYHNHHHHPSIMFSISSQLHHLHTFL